MMISIRERIDKPPNLSKGSSQPVRSRRNLLSLHKEHVLKLKSWQKSREHFKGTMIARKKSQTTVGDRKKAKSVLQTQGRAKAYVEISKESKRGQT